MYESLLQKFEEFIRKIGFVGMFDIDFYLSEGEFYFGELNLRIGGSGFAVINSGINLPEMYVRTMQGKSIENMKKEIDSIATYTNERVCMENWYAGFLSNHDFYSILKNRGISAVKSKNDRYPELIFWLKSIKKYFILRKKSLKK
jgi:biotin carboxylase